MSTEKSWACVCHPINGNRRTVVQANLVKMQDPIAKITKAKRLKVWFKQ
jgi:hypothetical protein